MSEGLPAVADQNTKLFVLGTFPSEESLRVGQYYANPRNQFWRLMEASLRTNLVMHPYEVRIEILLQNGCGLWDVFHSCERRGSLDASIQSIVINDFSKMTDKYPSLRMIC